MERGGLVSSFGWRGGLVPASQGVPLVGRWALVQAPPLSGSMSSLVSSSSSQESADRVVGGPGVHCIGPNRQCERVWGFRHVYAEVDPKTNSRTTE